MTLSPTLSSIEDSEDTTLALTFAAGSDLCLAQTAIIASQDPTAIHIPARGIQNIAATMSTHHHGWETMKSLIAFTRLLMLQPIHRCPGCLYLHRLAAHNEHSCDM
ncbi:hypothetical protein BBJ50_08115 [Cutibacterium acnes]|nr:hypothetical protein BBJ50_08115 [Cutibacterium acnes]